MYEPIKPSVAGSTNTPRYRVAACVGQHIGDRREQQDRAGIFTSERAKGCVLVVVADGMGGRTGGALAAEQVINSARTLFKDFNPQHDSVIHLLTEIVREAHTVIRLSAITSEKEPHSTMVALVLQPGQANWAHVGDSRLYYYKRKELSFKTIDHSYVEQLVKQGQLTRAEAKNHKMSHVLMSALGTKDQPFIDFGETRDLAPEDTFLLCSDGLWAYFRDDEMGEILSSLPPRVASESLIELARERARGKGDNCTLAILQLSPPGQT
ncbi:MAG: PP2C family protein-serine/threonine phosphatase [Burkholderiales bacterium]